MIIETETYLQILLPLYDTAHISLAVPAFLSLMYENLIEWFRMMKTKKNLEII